MGFRTILSIVGPDTPDRFIRQAAELAYEARAHFSLLVTVLAAPPPVGDYAAMISDSWLEEREEDNRILTDKLTAARALLATLSASSQADGLYCEESWAHAEIGARAIYADLVMIGGTRTIGATLRRQAIDGALFDAGRPALLVPDDKMPSLSPRKILLAWDSSPDAASAAREAIDLMKSAEKVEVVMVDPHSATEGKEPGADIATYLARHGLEVSINAIASSERPIASVLLQRAAELPADLLVMGAYGHSRLRERIFGGVTRSMIEDADIPIFLAR